MATTETFIAYHLYQIALALLRPDPNQPRKYLDPVSLDELTESIRLYGVLIPILFRVENGIFYIVAGERRCIAALRAGLTTIPAIYIETTNHDEIAVVENICRTDLTPIEEAEAFDRLLKLKSCKQEDLATMLSKTPAFVSQTLSLNKLPQTIRDACRKDPAIPKRVLISIAARKQERSMVTAFERYKASVSPEKKGKTGSILSKTESAVKAADATGQKIDALEVNDLYMEENAALAEALTTLKGKIENLLAAFEEPPTEEEASGDENQEESPRDETSEGDTPPETTPKKKKKIIA